MIPLEAFPAINASLNAASGVLLMMGLIFIKKGRREPHKICMLCACGVSLLFLSCYLYYHFHHGTTRFPHGGILRTAYFTVLLSHTALAATVPVLAGITLRQAAKQDWERHKTWARRTFPIWMYVSVTGVIIYLMLYHL